MKREAFKMFLKPGCEAEYEKRHNAIWPELKKLLSENGVCDYSIYWDMQLCHLLSHTFQKTKSDDQQYCQHYKMKGKSKTIDKTVMV